MVAHVILGINIDTPMWISKLKKQGIKNVYIFDYEAESENRVKLYEDVIYINQRIANEYLKKYKKVNFYTSLYAYPGMNGQMSSFNKK